MVIGVHSAKFQNEKETENIRRIILRYEIEHPVYNDSEYAVWQSYGVRAWPTQVLIDPAGYIIGGVSGEGNYELIDQAIAKVVEDFRKKFIFYAAVNSVVLLAAIFTRPSAEEPITPNTIEQQRLPGA